MTCHGGGLNGYREGHHYDQMSLTPLHTLSPKTVSRDYYFIMDLPFSANRRT